MEYSSFFNAAQGLIVFAWSAWITALVFPTAVRVLNHWTGDRFPRGVMEIAHIEQYGARKRVLWIKNLFECGHVLSQILFVAVILIIVAFASYVAAMYKLSAMFSHMLWIIPTLYGINSLFCKYHNIDAIHRAMVTRELRTKKIPLYPHQ